MKNIGGEYALDGQIHHRQTEASSGPKGSIDWLENATKEFKKNFKLLGFQMSKKSVVFPIFPYFPRYHPTVHLVTPHNTQDNKGLGRGAGAVSNSYQP